MGPPGAPPVTDVFGALAHPLRRQLVTALAVGDTAVGHRFTMDARPGLGIIDGEVLDVDPAGQ